MKILVVGYACNPMGGSEPGVGWAAACRIAREHEVCVLTDIHNKSGWEQAKAEDRIPPTMRVRFLRDSSACSENRFVAHLQSWLNYAAFNRRVLRAAEAWHREENFDLCHQVTIAAWRMPSPLWQLPIPFVWGPIGGGGYIPPAFRSMLSPSARFFESARDVQTRLALRSRAFRDCIRNTAVVFAANEETERLLRPYRGERPLIKLPIASVSDEKARLFERPRGEIRPQAPLRLFAGGNMEGRKGVSLALRALALAAEGGLDFHYTIAGGGPEIPALRQLARTLGLEQDRVLFHPGYSGQAYIAALHATDVYFLPSFRESTPVTLLEAYLAGCYPIVADIGAQGEIVRLAGGKLVRADNPGDLVRGLADALLWCGRHKEELAGLARNAAETVKNRFSSASYEKQLRDAYESARGLTRGTGK
jgi:glycosyltransferase involved in cell wall biosynthesis